MSGAGGPVIGSFVAWEEGAGRIDLVAERGVLPGLAEPVTVGERALARVTVWERHEGGGWRPTGAKAAVALADLVEVPPLEGAERTRSAQARLVDLVASHQRLADHLGLPPWSRPDGVAIKAVFERGRASWPGRYRTSLSAEEWAIGRVDAFLAVAGGVSLEGYRRDLDLLPLNHPARGRARAR